MELKLSCPILLSYPTNKHKGQYQHIELGRVEISDVIYKIQLFKPESVAALRTFPSNCARPGSRRIPRVKTILLYTNFC